MRPSAAGTKVARPLNPRSKTPGASGAQQGALGASPGGVSSSGSSIVPPPAPAPSPLMSPLHSPKLGEVRLTVLGKRANWAAKRNGLDGSASANPVLAATEEHTSLH